MEIGDRIKQKRVELGLSQEELGLKCGWENAKARISNYELNLRTPKIKDLINIAKALNVTPKWLTFGDT